MAANIGPAVALKQPGNFGGLFCSMLDQQHAVCGQDCTAIGRQDTNRIQAILACGQCRLRLVLQPEQRIVIAANIRGIRHDYVKQAVANWLGPVAMGKLHVAKRQRAHVFTGDGQRVFADVHSSDLAHAALSGDGDGNRAAAGTEVEHLPFGLAGNFAQGQIDEQLGLRPWYQGRRTDQ